MTPSLNLIPTTEEEVTVGVLNKKNIKYTLKLTVIVQILFPIRYNF